MWAQPRKKLYAYKMTIDAIKILYKIRKLTSYINIKSRIFNQKM